jgi:hypothetical protein
VPSSVKIRAPLYLFLSADFRGQGSLSRLASEKQRPAGRMSKALERRRRASSPREGKRFHGK